MSFHDAIPDGLPPSEGLRRKSLSGAPEHPEFKEGVTGSVLLCDSESSSHKLVPALPSGTESLLVEKSVDVGGEADGPSFGIAEGAPLRPSGEFSLLRLFFLRYSFEDHDGALLPASIILIEEELISNNLATLL